MFLNTKNLQKNETFGEIGFLSGENNTMYGKCLSVVHTASLKREDFLKIIQQFPEDYVHFLKTFSIKLYIFCILYWKHI